MSASPFRPDQWERIKDLFAEANELPAAQRVAFVETVTEGQPEIRAEVLRLLGHQPAGPAAIDRPLFGIAPIESALRPQSLVPGELLGGRFRVIRLLGRGGMGEVYECEDLQLKTHVAIKTIRPETIGDEKILARFRREIQLSRQVTHPNVCRVFDLLTITRGDGSALDCLTMELLEGETLAAFQRREGKLTEAQALPLLRQMVDALAAAHKANVVHRDLKPSNIILVPQATTPVTYRLVVTDFGLSRSLREGESHPSGSGWGMGTPSYMSPEQVDGTAIERASDIYSLGIILYEMLTGTLPFVGETAIEIALKRLKERPQPPRERNPQISQRWEKLILRCLELQPQDRFARVEDVLEGLVEVSSASRLFRLKPSRRRNLIAFGLALFLAIAGWQAYEYYSVPTFSSSAKALYESGLNFIEQGSPLQARLALEQAVQQAPDYAIAHARLAEVYIDLDNMDMAKDSILLASQGKAAPLDRERIQAIRSLVVRDIDAAIAQQQRIVSQSSAESRLISLIDLSRSLELAGATKGRREALEEALRIDPNNPYVLLNLARFDALQQNVKLANTRFSLSEEQFRQRGNSEGVGAVLLARAEQSRVREEIPDAEALLEQCAQVAASIQSPLLSLRAELSRLAIIPPPEQDKAKQEQLEAALARAEAMGAKILTVNGWIDLAFRLSTQGKIEEARRVYEKAIASAEAGKMQRALARARTSYGAFLHRHGDARAEDMLIKGAAYYLGNNLFVQGLQAKRFLIDVWFSSKRLAEAKKASAEMIEMAKARDLPAEHANFLLQLANIAEYQGEFPEALRLYGGAEQIFVDLKLEPRLRIVREYAADAQRQLGNPEPARQALLQLLASVRGKNLYRQLTAELQLAQMEIDKGNIGEARRQLTAIEALAKKEAAGALGFSLHMARCKLEAEWGDSAKGVQCMLEANKFPTYRKNSIRYSFLLAAAQSRAGQFEEARQSVQEAIRSARQLGMVDNLVYALPILAEIQKGLKDDAAWQATRQEWIDLVKDLYGRWGKEVTSTYLRRPIYAKHWQNLQPGF